MAPLVIVSLCSVVPVIKAHGVEGGVSNLIVMPSIEDIRNVRSESHPVRGAAAPPTQRVAVAGRGRGVNHRLNSPRVEDVPTEVLVIFSSFGNIEREAERLKERNFLLEETDSHTVRRWLTTAVH